MGLYGFVDAVFGKSHNATLKDVTFYKKEDTDTSEFMIETAHQLEDLMDGLVIFPSIVTQTAIGRVHKTVSWDGQFSNVSQQI